MRREPSLDLTPVIALTALAMRGDEERARSSGFDDYLTKPIEQEALVEGVRRAIERRRAGPP